MDRTDYIKNPEKTDHGNLISSFMCNPEFVAAEFALSKKEYQIKTGRDQNSNVIAYQVRQSFKPGEISPEEANRIGYEFAERFLKGNHAFIVCTHIDKAHIHNHIVWNSTTLDATRKFKYFRRSGMAVRKLSDLICIEHQLSVVEKPKKHGKSYDEWLGKEDDLSFRDRLRIVIDQALKKKPNTIDELIKLLELAGYDIKRGKHISCKLENQKKYIRLSSLGEGYSEAELLAVMKNEKPHEPFIKRKYPKREQKTTLLSQLETKINSGRGVSYDQALKVIKVKQMAKSIAFIQERGFRSIEELSKATADSENLFNEQRAQIKKLEARMEEVSILRTHILNYMKTKATFDAYKKSGYSKKFLEEHEGEIVLHRASKKAFNQLGLKKLPTIKSLNDEFATLSAQKKAVYDAYRKTKSERRELMTHKANVEFILGLDETNPSEREYQYE